MDGEWNIASYLNETKWGDWRDLCQPSRLNRNDFQIAMTLDGSLGLRWSSRDELLFIYDLTPTFLVNHRLPGESINRCCSVFFLSEMILFLVAAYDFSLYISDK